MKFYRYQAVQYAQLDSYTGEYVSSPFPNPQLELNEYVLLKETPKGYWIGYGSLDVGNYSWKKWVSKTTRKRFAYPTKKEALINYIKRTERRIGILENHLTACKIGLELAKIKAKKHEIQSTKN
jgi:hypothetical protein